jgi:hypothetical protein
VGALAVIASRTRHHDSPSLHRRSEWPTFGTLNEFIAAIDADTPVSKLVAAASRIILIVSAYRSDMLRK